MSEPIVMSEQVHAACNRITSASNVAYASAAREVVHAYQAMLDDYNTAREELEAKAREADAIEKMYRVEQGTTDRVEQGTTDRLKKEVAQLHTDCVEQQRATKQLLEEREVLHQRVEDAKAALETSETCTTRWMDKFDALYADRIPFAEAFAKPLRERIVQLEAALVAEQGDINHTLELGRVCGAMRVKDWRNAGEAAYQLQKSNDALRADLAARLDEVAVKAGQISELEKSLEFTRKLALQPQRCCCSKEGLP